MATKIKQWSTGTGSATIEYTGQGDGQITITSDPNSVYEARSMQITVETTDGSGISRTVTIQQAAKQRIDISAAVVTAATQTYDGGAKTPTPTVTLNGSTVPSSGYDVSYSNNTNAGTATITVTGKGDYTGTATGTFTINKATPTYTAPTARSLTYSGSAQYLTTTGSTSHGTIQYSNDGTNWYTTRRQGTNAGSYTTYWRLIGDSNHNDIASTSISVTIAKKSRTISWNSYPSSLYVGRSSTLSATPSAGSSDGTISYSSSNSSKASVSGSTVTAVASGTCTIYASISEGTNYLSASSSYTLTVNAIPSGFVDMGVSVLWAEKNIGASSIYSYDCSFFSWGNIDEHIPTNTSSFSPYDWGTANDTEPYKSSIGATLTGNIGANNDAARQILGSPCRMPTAAEFSELFRNVKYINADGSEIPSSNANKLVTINGITGIYIESNINGNRLFIPCCGHGRSTAWEYRGTYGYYWSSTYNTPAAVRFLYISSGGVFPQNNSSRFYGNSIRAVREL